MLERVSELYCPTVLQTKTHIATLCSYFVRKLILLTRRVTGCTGKAIKGSREKYVIATKFGNKRLPDGTRVVDGSPKYVHEACDASLKRLQIDYIDLYYQHRVDREVGIETTVKEMKVTLIIAAVQTHTSPRLLPM